MSAHNPDQDEYDPSMEEGAEDFSFEEEPLEGGEAFGEETYAEESFGDEEFSDDESWDENFDENGGALDEEAPSERPAKKKGGLFNVAVIALALLGGGAFVYMKVLAPQNAGPAPAVQPVADAQGLPQDDQTAQQAAQQNALPTEPVEAPVDVPVNTALPAPADGGPLMPEPTLEQPPALANADGALPTLDAQPSLTVTPEPQGAVGTTVPEPAPTAPVMAEPVTPAVTAPATPDATASVEQPVEVTSAPPMPAPIATPAGENVAQNDGFNAGLPSARDIMLAPSGTNAPQAAAIPAPAQDTAQAGGLSADAARSIEQKLSVLITRLDTFENRITNLEAGVHQVSGKITALEAKPAAAANLDSVNSAIKTLENKISALENAPPASAPAKPAAVAQEPAPVKAAPSSSPADISNIDQPTFVPAAPESEPRKTLNAADTPKVESPAKAEKAPAAEPARSAGWILRSAQPGTAMVVAKTGGEMRTVRVGDTLAGLGRITSIEQRGSKWVVQGTQGTLTH